MHGLIGRDALEALRLRDLKYPQTAKRRKRAEREARERAQPWLRQHPRLYLSGVAMKVFLEKTVIPCGGVQRKLRQWDFARHGRCARPIYLDVIGRGLRKPVSPRRDRVKACTVRRGVADPLAPYGADAVETAKVGFAMAGAGYVPIPAEEVALLSGPGDPHRVVFPHKVTMTVRCRRCEKCLRYRKWKWTCRASEEFRFAFRTRLVTLTLAPNEQAKARLEAQVFEEKRGNVFEDLSRSEQREAVHQAIYRNRVSPWIRKLRRRGIGFRFVCVFESHKSGEPHMHLLMHETKEGALQARPLKAAWSFGHMHSRVISVEEAAYTLKYVSKDAETRIRASQMYGKPHIAAGKRAGVLLEPERAAVAPWVVTAQQHSDGDLANWDGVDERERDADEWLEAELRREVEGWKPLSGVGSPSASVAEQSCASAVACVQSGCSFPRDPSWEAERIARHSARPTWVPWSGGP